MKLLISIIEKKWKILLCFYHTQWEVFCRIKFHPRRKFYSFHPGMKFTCKQKFFHPGTSFIRGWDFISVTGKRTLFKVIKIENSHEWNVKNGVLTLIIRNGKRFNNRVYSLLFLMSIFLKHVSLIRNILK